ncbi:MAG TPA: GWxTD domain-containing protein [Bryobacteraceae bacterium]|nr:GWxTD domain-containing protein [Bryobacteraceae bacterium]
MKLLEILVRAPLTDAIGWTLLHSLWEGAIVSAALATVLWAARSPRARYAAGCVAMLVMVVGLGVTFARLMPESAHGLQTSRAPGLPAWNVQSGMAGSRAWAPTLAAIAPWLAPFWMAGVFVFYLRHVAGWISVQRLRRRGVCCAPDGWQNELTRLSAQLRISRPVMLLQSCLADVPMVLGHFRPLILMPIDLFAGLPAGQIEPILLHELAHIRRYDYLVNVLQRSVEGLLFYHPAVWWISRVIRAERENCCDDAVVAIRGNAHEYAIALAALEQNRWSGREPAIAATGGNLVKRIRRLLYPTRPNGAWTPFFAAVILSISAAISMAGWETKPPHNNSVSTQQQKDDAAVSPYSKWLNEEVVYIIAPEERAAFERLTTDEEREKFIEQFWLRRDPTPGTPENEFKEEHYRRIAYANSHFASSRAGWQTDRGHMYILYGPPDEIDSHPNGHPQSAYPFEDWMYLHVKGMGDNVYFRFIDPTRQGEYQLAPGTAK